MTTENITGIDALREQINAAAEQVRSRAHLIDEEATHLQRQRQKDAVDAAIAARLIDQAHIDALAGIDEEAGQLANILAVVQPAPAAPDNNDHGHDHSHDDDDDDDELAPAAQTVVINNTNHYNPTSWSWVQWIGALIGFVIALAIWSNWPEFPGRNLNEGLLRNLVNFFWFVAHAAAGFFIGGRLGAFFDSNNT